MSVYKASIIILAWNGRSYLAACLEAVNGQQYPDFEVIVVDNGSTDGSAEFVAEHFPHSRLIRNESNLGFAAGNNIGLREANGDILVLLNQDTAVRPGWLQALVAPFDGDNRIGIVGCKAVFPDGRVQHAGAHIDDHGLSIHYNYQQVDDQQAETLRDVDYVIGASLAIKRSALDTIGVLDEGFTPAYYEDADWCYRARLAGLRVVYTPNAVFVHKESRLGAGSDYASMAMVHRNRLRFVLKHWSLGCLTDMFEPAEREWLVNLDQGSETMIAGVQHAYFHHLLHLDEMIRYRQQLQGAPASEAETIASLLLRLRAISPLKPAGGLAVHNNAPERPKVTPLPRHSSTPTAMPDLCTEINPPPDIPAFEAAPSPEQVSLGAEKRQETSGANLPDPPTQEVPDFPSRLLSELKQTRTLREFQFRSRVPILGRFIAALRHLWNKVSTEWYVRSLIQQQTAFNAGIVQMAETLATQVQTLVTQNQALLTQLQILTAQNKRLESQVDELKQDQQQLAKAMSSSIEWMRQEHERLNAYLRAFADRYDQWADKATAGLKHQNEQLSNLLLLERQQIASLQDQLNQHATWLMEQEYRLSLRLDYHENRIDQEQYDRERLGIVLSEYIQENGREIAELTRAIITEGVQAIQYGASTTQESDLRK